MQNITIKTVPGFEEWRGHARRLLNEGFLPSQILWADMKRHQTSFLGHIENHVMKQNAQQFMIPKAFIEMAQIVICHADYERFDLLYRVLYRILHENKNLLQITTDKDVMAITAYYKAVRRDAYKITAFLRFRSVELNGEEHFIAWYEPEHYTLELKLDFFMKRFKNMHWSIMTPYRAAHWDQKRLRLEDNPDPSLYPKDDAIEKYWLTYYGSIYNPARLKKKAMMTQMPKKYWKNMPETKLIPDLINTSEKRVKEMIDNQNS
jgi:DNA polymerase